MDDPNAPREELAVALRFLRLLNARLGGSGALLSHFKTWSRRWPKDRPITLLDVATGSADIPVQAVRWARRAGFDLRVTAIDAHPTTLDLAREHVAACGLQDAITLVHADALRLTDLYAPRSFDYAHSSLFLHHLSDIHALTVLRIMDRLARAGVVWNDLVRSRTALAGAWLCTLGMPRHVRHDAIVSVRAGFTRSEAMNMAARVDIERPVYSYAVPIVPYRFTLAREKPKVWE
jgi:hypothetical protein